MNKGRKILIIKTGFSEFLDRGISTTVSLGDVLACTAILHLYKEDQVTWVTAWSARELLQGNPFIHELLIFGPRAIERVSAGSYDILINLEKDIGICTILSQIKAAQRYGFFFNEKIHDITTYNPSSKYLLSGQENHRDITKSFFEILFETVGEHWRGEGLVLVPRQRSPIKFDIGFNYEVGTKWPTKAWPIEKWKELERILQGRLTISWQEGNKNLTQYIEWIDSCRLIVTSDSLGQSLGLSLGKKVIALYGPTNSRRMKEMPNLTTIDADSLCTYMPCYLPFCKNDHFCMDQISPEKVASKCEELLCPEIPSVAALEKVETR